MTKLLGKEKITIKSDETVKFARLITLQWNPKVNITTFELAQCIPYLNYSGMPGATDLSLPFLRHFNIIDPNK